MQDIMKIVKSLEECSLLIKCACETIEKEAKIFWCVIRNIRCKFIGKPVSRHYIDW